MREHKEGGGQFGGFFSDLDSLSKTQKNQNYIIKIIKLSENNLT